MFNYDELDNLANEAKRKLKAQDSEGETDKEEISYEQEEVRDEFEIRNEITDEDNYNNFELDESPYDGDNYEDKKLSSYDNLLFPGGPTQSRLELWKKDWVGYNIYVTEILNHMFIFRTLNRFEYKQLISLQNCDALQREEIICKTVTLFPDEYGYKEMAKTLAGLPSTYAEIIMEKSGFTKDYAIQVL